MSIATIAELKESIGQIGAALHCQVDSTLTKQTQEQKPFLEIVLRDATSSFTLRVWSDQPAYSFCTQLRPNSFIEIQGDFAMHPKYGLEARNWSARFLSDEEASALVAGPEDVRKKQGNDFNAIVSFVGSIRDPRLNALCRLFLEELGDRFKRAAGARNYHHSRRGGLVEHVAQMMRSADSLATVYPTLNRDLLIAGILFHDAGKLWENCYAKESFVMPYDLWGELLGHIPIGVELVNRLWNRLKENPEFTKWNLLSPDSGLVRSHLIHLVAAHHGEKEFGSPVEPKTPEAMALHYIDNLDAKLEMMANAYRAGKRIGQDVIERVRPLPANLVVPLKPVDDEGQNPRGK
jgi:3'-5' exoribonuclease